MNPIGIFAKTFQRPNVYEVFKAVKNHSFTVTHFNFECAGLPAMPTEIPATLLEEIHRAGSSLSLDLAGVSGTFNMAHPDQSVRLDGLARLEVIAASCPKIGTRLITLCTGTRDPHDKWTFHPDNNSRSAWNDLLQTMEKAILIAEKHDLQLGIEPELANVVNSVEKARQLLSDLESDRLKIVLDPANLFETADEKTIKRLISAAIDQLGPTVAMAHAKDRDVTGNFVPPGQGIIPFDFFVQQLKAADIHCPLIAHGFGEEEAQAVADYLATCL